MYYSIVGILEKKDEYETSFDRRKCGKIWRGDEQLSLLCTFTGFALQLLFSLQEGVWSCLHQRPIAQRDTLVNSYCMCIVIDADDDDPKNESPALWRPVQEAGDFLLDSIFAV